MEPELKEGFMREKVGQYKVLEKIGEGSYAIVYKCLSESRQEVAIKIFKDTTHNYEVKRNFIQETSMYMQLDCESIVKYVDFGECRDGLFIVLEYCSHGSLKDRLERKGQFSEYDVLATGIAVTEALNELNYKGVVHRDIKPDNLLIPSSGLIKLADMGLARIQHNVEREFNGTPYYMSPEQISTANEIDWRSDQYNLGCTLYHLLTGEPPYQAKNVYSVSQKHLKAPIPDPRVSVNCTEAISKIIIKMMAKCPEERYQEPQELLSDLYCVYNGATTITGLINIKRFEGMKVLDKPKEKKKSKKLKLKFKKLEKPKKKRRRSINKSNSTAYLGIFSFFALLGIGVVVAFVLNS